jgi:phage repressor protein C with HTH and peptisase S24 domain
MAAHVLDKARWLKATRDQLGWSAKEVADQAKRIASLRCQHLSLTQQAVSHFETGKSKSVPDWLDFVEEAARLAALPEQERMERELFIEAHPNGMIEALVDEQEYQILQELNARPAEQKAALLATLQVGTDLARTGGQTAVDAASALDLVPIGEIDQDYGMGGTFTDGPVAVQVHHFPRVWVESISPSPPDMLTIARGKGDSMDPTIRDRDMVIIDRSRRTLDEADAIWALTVGDIGMIKRLRRRGQIVVIQSDNDRVSDEKVYADEVNIVGRVVFIGRRT